MENANPSHFFQPLLPNFQNHLNIPVNFFSEHIEGKYEGETVKLKSDASERTWTVKIVGQRLTEGWKEFVEAHNLRVGDFVVLRHEGNLLFHVTALGPSCCEIQYAQSRSQKEDEESDENGKKEDHIGDKTIQNRFVKLTPTPSSLELGKQYLPVSFTRGSRLIKPGNIIMVDRTGAEWSMELKFEQRRRSMYIWSRHGWKDFCVTNGVNAYESLILEFIGGGTRPLFKFCSNMEQIPFEAVARKNKTGPKFKTREKTTEEGESSRFTRSRTKQGNLRQSQPSSFSDQVAKVKQSVVDTLTSIRRFRAELETVEHKLEDSLQEFNNLGSCSNEREDNENETTSSSDNHV